ncbi:hypothetical protein H5410_004176 [Solanum commersonii]|uniref:Uncharacterized protein n=1 Tax=Solanum commersonii TaxID=4109 RepID=A0A9J6B779_SOLCO|nr:hypothetical protein H5410_004176 [Solanum commersonii]
MIWVSQDLREASKTKGNVVKRWRKSKDRAKFFCARNYNKFEVMFNSGWEAIVDKVGRCIVVRRVEENRNLHRLIDNNIPYAESLRSSKWASNKEAEDNVVASLMKGALSTLMKNLHLW